MRNRNNALQILKNAYESKISLTDHLELFEYGTKRSLVISEADRNECDTWIDKACINLLQGQLRSYVKAWACIVILCYFGSDSGVIMFQLRQYIYGTNAMYARSYTKHAPRFALNFVATHWHEEPNKCWQLITMVYEFAGKASAFRIVASEVLMEPEVGLQLGQLILTPSLNYFTLKVYVIAMLSRVLPQRQKTSGAPFVSCLWTSTDDDALWKQFPVGSKLGDPSVLKYLELVDQLILRPAQETFPLANKVVAPGFFCKEGRFFKRSVYIDLVSPNNVVVWFSADCSSELKCHYLCDPDNTKIKISRRQVYLDFVTSYINGKRRPTTVRGGLSSSWLCRQLDALQNTSMRCNTPDIADSEASTETEDETVVSSGVPISAPVVTPVVTTPASSRAIRTRIKRIDSSCSPSTQCSQDVDSRRDADSTVNQTTVNSEDTSLGQFLGEEATASSSGDHGEAAKLAELERHMQAAVQIKLREIASIKEQLLTSNAACVQEVVDSVHNFEKWTAQLDSDGLLGDAQVISPHAMEILATWVRKNAWHRD